MNTRLGKSKVTDAIFLGNKDSRMPSLHKCETWNIVARPKGCFGEDEDIVSGISGFPDTRIPDYSEL